MCVCVQAEVLSTKISVMKKQMQEAASALDFERAAALRDRIRDLEAEQLRVG